MLHDHNPHAAQGTTYGDAVSSALQPAGATEAHAVLSGWAEYAPTPLMTLSASAARLGVGSLHYKDESGRFGLGSFKALGGAYAIDKHLQSASPSTPRTFVCATDGNHGRSVAWGARRAGASAHVVLPAAVSPGRERAIADLGADITRVDGTYDDAVRHADELARRNEWVVISDTAYPGYEHIPIDIMHGYAVCALETAASWPDPPTHVFLQAGVGGFAAATCMQLWAIAGPERPRFIVVEPAEAACCHAAARHDGPVQIANQHETVMACLAAGIVSTVAWPVLRAGVDDFLVIGDAFAVRAMKQLAEEKIVAGESGAAGFAGLLATVENPVVRDSMGLDDRARVLVFGTEGATDPDIYERIVAG